MVLPFGIYVLYVFFVLFAFFSQRYGNRDTVKPGRVVCVFLSTDLLKPNAGGCER